MQTCIHYLPQFISESSFHFQIKERDKQNVVHAAFLHIYYCEDNEKKSYIEKNHVLRKNEM